MRFLIVLGIAGLTTTVAAQDAPPTGRLEPCDGRRVSRVEIRRSARTMIEKAGAPSWARTLLQPLLLGTPTRPSAIAPFLQLHDGGPCTERRRSESERLLRQLPYIADATVTVFDETDGTVRIEVETIDDIRPVIGVGLRQSRLQDVELGNSNISGTGQLAALRWRDGRAFRDGFGLRYADYSILNGPNVAVVNVALTPLGSFAQYSLSRPFLTDLQHTAGFAGYVKDDGYATFTRIDGDAFSIRSSRERADAGFALRVNTIGRVSWLVGALTSLERRGAGDRVVRITDTGFVDTADVALTGRYQARSTTRAGLVLGMRALSFAKVRAFDGLESVQDVARGLQLSTTLGRGIAGDDRRNFATLDLYTGAGGFKSFVGMRVQMEARQRASGWGDGVASGRLAWYRHPSTRQTHIVSLEYAGASSDSVPYQLTIADPLSGVRGYTGSRLSGGRRMILRLERRFIMPGISRYLGWGVGAFADAGQMWAAKVPFGETGLRTSAGITVLSAVPRASRSVARVDVAYPLVPDKHAKGFDIRVTYRITGRAFWREPTQLTRARLGSPTTDIFSWP